MLIAFSPAFASAAVSTNPYTLPGLAAPTGPITTALVLQRFEEIDKNLKSLSADFRQSVNFEQSGMAQSLEGTLEYRKPKLLHIEHKRPEPQTIVCDGNWLWIWRRSTNQVIQTNLEQWRSSEPSAAGLLDFGNYGELLKRYDVSVASESAGAGHRNFELALRPKAGAQTGDYLLKLTVSTRNFFPLETELKAGSMKIRSVLSNIRYNPPMAEERFQFTPPTGADVFKNFKPPRLGSDAEGSKK
ncbi:MAG: hypothetical protein A3J74_11405 [Elusimicrobia bacterium RIFCSPHIGHO2_02_FULL_57_9]|nr:MAG: hypothetical protein A3J74_11405 [Elusimicrobia bacterium RIFCSPHIGHO2_02_FULL_57_9]